MDGWMDGYMNIKFWKNIQLWKGKRIETNVSLLIFNQFSRTYRVPLGWKRFKKSLIPKCNQCPQHCQEKSGDDTTNCPFNMLHFTAAMIKMFCANHFFLTGNFMHRNEPSWYASGNGCCEWRRHNEVNIRLFE